MKESPSALLQWLDSDFFAQGAFLTSSDGRSVTFAKGGTFETVNHFLATSSPVFYLKDFFKDSHLAYIPQKTITLSVDECHLSSTLQADFSPEENLDHTYETDFLKLKEAFGEELKKVVLVSREYYQNFQGEETIRHLMAKAFSFGSGMPYGIWNSEYGVIGSTPELLYDVTQDELRTFALAGTAKVGEEKELLESKKDRLEHDLVIQDIQEKLRPFSVSLAISPTGIHPYKSIVHLRTDIKAKISQDLDFTQLTNSLSPTAALGGYTKMKALKFLGDSHYTKMTGQRYFGSAFGLMSGEIKEFVVSIRNIQWRNNRLFIDSGGGVVPESELSKELAEINLKRNTIRKHYL